MATDGCTSQVAFGCPFVGPRQTSIRAGRRGHVFEPTTRWPRRARSRSWRSLVGRVGLATLDGANVVLGNLSRRPPGSAGTCRAGELADLAEPVLHLSERCQHERELRLVSSTCVRDRPESGDRPAPPTRAFLSRWRACEVDLRLLESACSLVARRADRAAGRADAGIRAGPLTPMKQAGIGQRHAPSVQETICRFLDTIATVHTRYSRPLRAATLTRRVPGPRYRKSSGLK